VTFDRILADLPVETAGTLGLAARQDTARWAFLVLVGYTALVKGIGFGIVLMLVVIAGILVWQRDLRGLRLLWFPVGRGLTTAIAMACSLLMVEMYGRRVLMLWMIHMTDRLVGRAGSGIFAGETWWEYGSGLAAQSLPWGPLALIRASPSLRRAVLRNGGAVGCGLRIKIPAAVIAGDRLL
jgi:hypothetical protein